MALVLPGIYVEIGLSASSPATPPPAFRLGDATYALLDTAILGADTVWTDISPDVNSFTITRPSTRLQGPLWNFQAGTVSITLDNSDAKYDPDNLAGPFVVGGVTQLTPMVPVRVRASFGSFNYSVYYGFADGWFPAEITYDGDYAELTLSATDAFKVLAGINLPTIAITGIGVDAGARIKDILSRAGWYTTAEKQTLDVGNSLLQGTTLGSDALSLMQIAVDSELGQLYPSGTGAVVFRSRRALLTDTRSNTIQATFGDMADVPDGTGTPWSFPANGTPADGTYFVASNAQAALLTVGDYFTDSLNPGRKFVVTVIGGNFAGFNNISISPTAPVIMNSPDVVSEIVPQFPVSAVARTNDDVTLVNDVQATRVGGTIQEVQDSASIGKYLFPRSYSRSDLILQNDTDALNWAQWVLYVGKGAENRFESVRINPLADPANLWPQVLGREIGDRIQVRLRPNAIGVVITKDCFIMGITHEWNSADSQWFTTWQLQAADKYGSFLTLDNPTLGQIGSNAITF